mgnify:CR=1 FL=1
MKTCRFVISAVVLTVCAGSAHAGQISLTRAYTVEAGGSNQNGLGGLAAEATFTVQGRRMHVTLRNTSTAVPDKARVNDVLLSSLAFNLPSDVRVTSGDRAALAADSRGVGAWSTRREHSSVSDGWMWTEGGLGGDLGDFSHAVTTDRNLGDAEAHNFGFGRMRSRDLKDSFGGLISGETASLFRFNGRSMAVENSLMFTFTLDQQLTRDALAVIANTAVVEFGDDFQYLESGSPAHSLSVIPLPGAAGLAAIGFVGLAASRRR